MSRVAAFAVALGVLAAACGGDGAVGGSDPDGVVVIGAPSPLDAPWEEIGGFDESIESCPPGIGNDPIAEAGPQVIVLQNVLDLPDASAIAFTDDGDAFVGERSGRLYRWGPSLVGPVLDLSDDTLVDNDAGLLGLAVDPTGERLYLYRNDAGGDSVLSAYRLEGGRLDGSSGTEVLRADQPTSQHNGGSIAFDAAGYAYLSLGDGGGLGDPFRTAQDVESPFGALLRFEPRPGRAPAAVAPPDNPYAGAAPGHDLIWAIGVRNLYRFSFDTATGDLWAGDVGQQCAEEIDLLPGGGTGGENLGWNVYEGRRPFLGELAPGQTHHEPVFAYSHTDGRCAVIAGHVYRGPAVPDLQGRFVFADHCSGEIMALDPATGTAEVLLSQQGMRVVEIAADRAGELYVVDLTSGVWKIRPV